ncbi:spore cortex biosynthesis protein YabQ [Heyndrickxia acidiproducens]|jgi:spore cortex biosynthesis protein YabQ|uniref:spore cortex biosynthesis protein YabQ n=1 Tax=Heyndrickxia acidiproducens TaxID=1121084 RepID=UPI000375B5B8|nr:spore cortex biosynthesis protein YabQ [Heyndrickxia acidiproducens]
MSLTVQFYTMLAMIAMGSFFGCALDTYNRFLKRSERKRWIVFIHDILFWLCISLLLFYVLFMVNSGEVRFYIFVALFCGFAAYQALLKRIYLSILEWWIQAAVSIARMITRLFRLVIFNPARWLILGLAALVLGTGRAFYAIVKGLAKVILWILKIIFKPAIWIGTAIWHFVPEPAKKFFADLFANVAGVWGFLKNIVMKAKKRLSRFFKK